MISVIVVEYNKRGYLKHALNSVFNQSLDKGLYEVILTKKEEDKEVDDYARKNGAKIIYDDSKRQGEFMYNAIQEAKGDIITFLDDDDMYDENRLQVINKAFKERRIGGFRNQVILIDQSGNKVGERKIKEDVLLNPKTYNHRKHIRLLFNSSSMALRRELIEPDLKSIELAVDAYFIFASICNKLYEGLYQAKDKLTFYRVHPQNTSNFRFDSKSITLTSRYFHDYNLVYNKFRGHSKEIDKTLMLYLSSSKVSIYLLSLSSNRRPEVNLTTQEKMIFSNPWISPYSLKRKIRRASLGLVLFLPNPIRDKIVLFTMRKILKRV
ncbi:MAG: glycosyltransferase [Metallosphaera sp.]|uniref:glycosyltransferase n=1 Tax=Metallosphaera sp. TaxID=2020860 RepID=UPI003161D252